MILATTEAVVGKRIIKVLGLVRGNTIRARHIGRDISAVFRNIAGGEIHEIGARAEVAEELTAREIATAQAAARAWLRLTTSIRHAA